MRLIDADALKSAMYHEAFETDSEMQKWDSGCWIRYKMFEKAIEHAPTIEAEPVNHGQNIGPDYAACDQFVCSECGIELQDWRRVERDDDTGDWVNSEYVFRYCPNCGARMGGGKDDG